MANIKCNLCGKKIPYVKHTVEFHEYHPTAQMAIPVDVFPLCKSCHREKHNEFKHYRKNVNRGNIRNGEEKKQQDLFGSSHHK